MRLNYTGNRFTVCDQDCPGAELLGMNRPRGYKT